MIPTDIGGVCVARDWTRGGWREILEYRELGWREIGVIVSVVRLRYILKKNIVWRNRTMLLL